MKLRQSIRHRIQINGYKNDQETQNYEELYERYEELSGIYISMKKDIETMKL